MITVWNTPIAASVEQILRDLKLMLFAEGLLRDQNNTGSDVMVTCPFHKGGHERKGWLGNCDSYRLFKKYMEPLIEYMQNYYEREVKDHGEVYKCYVQCG